MDGRQAGGSTQPNEPWDHPAFRLWSEQVFLAPEEEHGRQAAHRLAQALEVAIREELSPAQRQVLERYWFDGAKTPQIARELGLNRSTVARNLRRAQEKLQGHLKYAVLALHGDAPDFAQALAGAAQALAAGGCPESSVGVRCRKLRLQQALTPKQLAVALSVDEAAVSRWERDAELPDTPALIGMARLFGVRADDILFGLEGGMMPLARPCNCGARSRQDPGPSA